MHPLFLQELPPGVSGTFRDEIRLFWRLSGGLSNQGTGRKQLLYPLLSSSPQRRNFPDFLDQSRKQTHIAYSFISSGSKRQGRWYVTIR